jgi:hypothetical protein
MTRWALAAVLCPAMAMAQSRTMQQGPHRMELTLERLERETWKTINPGLVLAQGDRVRFRFRSNFDGYLYVSNHSSSGTSEQLFPRTDTGSDNRITAAHDYQVPSTATAFRVAGPPGYETVYWLVSPTRFADSSAWKFETPKLNLTPRCDDAIFQARGSCIDSSAGPKLVPRELALPQPLADAAQQARQLVVVRDETQSVISSPVPLSGPVVYEFRLAHR